MNKDEEQEKSEGGIVVKCRKNSFLKLFVLWGMLVAGHLSAFMMFCGVNSFRIQLIAAAVGHLALIPLSAIVYTAIGPLSIISFALFMFHIRGGTSTAVGSLLIGGPLMYFALAWGFRRWWKTSSRIVRYVGWIMIASYSALATYCLLYVSSVM